MKCPIDGTTLTMSERSGIEIDYCPDCRGVWLDRGELDKILERAATDAAPAPSRRDDPRPRGTDPRYEAPRHTPRKKREHWLMEIFD